ncbi:MAG: hypothetical protein KIS61_11385 [Candidatus Eremiobacteraeota bacterium]|nr:hypothetical protein [Candidatus Eremiobacteraeota bacterium]
MFSPLKPLMAIFCLVATSAISAPAYADLDFSDKAHCIILNINGNEGYLVEELNDGSGLGFVRIFSKPFLRKVTIQKVYETSGTNFNGPIRGAKDLGMIGNGARSVITPGQPGCLMSESPDYRFPVDSIELIQALRSNMQEVQPPVYNRKPIGFDIRVARSGPNLPFRSPTFLP